MFGREVNLPVDVIFPVPGSSPDQDVGEYASKLRNELQECYDTARTHLKAAATRQKRHHDTHLNYKRYAPGDLVYKRSFPAKMLVDPWVGPYVVVTAIGDCLYKVQSKKKATFLHHDLLKP